MSDLREQIASLSLVSLRRAMGGRKVESSA
jgi:hypothetical protein